MEDIQTTHLEREVTKDESPDNDMKSIMNEDKSEKGYNKQVENHSVTAEFEESGSKPAEGSPSINEESPINTETQIEDLKKNLEIEKDKDLRLLAEYDNFRRRTLSDFTRIRQTEAERLIVQLLPVLDDFNRLLQHKSEEITLETLRQGTELIHRKMQEKLEGEGLQSIDADGKIFDVNQHEALTQMENDSYEDGTILTVVDKGYKLKDKVIRHAKVIVSRKPSELKEEINE